MAYEQVKLLHGNIYINHIFRTDSYIGLNGDTFQISSKTPLRQVTDVGIAMRKCISSVLLKKEGGKIVEVEFKTKDGFGIIISGENIHFVHV